jgi:hypothetical protein
MTYRGHIHNGTVVLEDPIDLPDGCKVQCELTSLDVPKSLDTARQGGIFGDLMEFAGSVKGTPPERIVGAVRLPTFKGDGLQPGVDLDDSCSLRSILDSDGRTSQIP